MCFLTMEARACPLKEFQTRYGSCGPNLGRWAKGRHAVTGPWQVELNEEAN
jgi:hypothetical protein